LRLSGALGVVVLLFALLGPGRGRLGGGLTDLFGGGATSAAAASAAELPTAGDVLTPELGLPATGVVTFGASPQEQAGEFWAYGSLGSAPAVVNGQSYSNQYALLERTEASGWQVVPLPPGRDGKPLSDEGSPAEYGALAGQATAAGGVVLLSGQNIVVRDPGGQPQLLPKPQAISASSRTPEGVLAEGESLLPAQASEGDVTVPYAAIEEATGGTGVLIAPQDDGGDPKGKPSTQPGVLHYDGQQWTREPIELAEADEENFTALALACGPAASGSASSSPRNCWLLASATSGSQTGLLLFEREPSGAAGQYSWQREPVSDWLLGEASSPSGVSQRTVAPLSPGAQMLTVTAQGAWVDFQTQVNGELSPVDVTELVTPGNGTAQGKPATLPVAAVAGTWCYPAGVVCPAERTLGTAPLPAQYRSFAWSAPGEEFGTRIVTGLAGGLMLELAGSNFTPTIGLGEGSGASAPGAAAFAAPQAGRPALGMIAEDTPVTHGGDGEGQSQVLEVDTQSPGDQFQEEAVPFRRPLLAVAQAPGSASGAPGAEAIAVGVEGEVAHYTPGQGWHPESLYSSSGKAQAPNLRGVAWPEPNRAYAVGDEGQMWVWRSETGLWEPDPAKPFNFGGNLTAIAFSASNEQRGYAVGEQGVLLQYGKSWEQVQSLPAELQQANFTSVTFAGEEALAAYRTMSVQPDGSLIETGSGLAVEDGSGWRDEPEVTTLLEQLSPSERVISKVAGLPDGGVVAAGPEFVIERDSQSSTWHFSPQPLPEAQDVSALAAYREAPSGPVRAIVSIDLDSYLHPQNSVPSAATGEAAQPPLSSGHRPPVLLGPEPLPASGYVLEETAHGWADMEHAALPAPSGDLPVRPDPVLALLVDPTGAYGLAVGGQTGDATGSGPEPNYETGAAQRFPAAAATSNGATPTTVQTPVGQASFIVAGQAACAHPCADFANESLGPEVWLQHALQSASAIAAHAPGGLRAFLYTGSNGGENVLSRDLLSYGGSPPVYASGEVAAPQERAGPAGTGAYSFLSEGTGGPVLVFVLDFASGTLGAAQEAWLSSELTAAKAQGIPAIAMGSAPPSPALAKILVPGGASAYFFDSQGGNIREQLDYGTVSIPAYGSGTLGYENNSPTSGYLLASVDTAARSTTTNIAPTTAAVVPNIAQLALNATDGVLLRRSSVALFEALARRPLAGEEITGMSSSGGEIFQPNPYDQIPFDCQGPECGEEIPTEYTFSSSNPDIGDFVAHENGNGETTQVQLGANKLPVPDSHSGLFCAYNEGTTNVSIATGGLTYTETVTVQGGSVEYPCGTVPLKNPPARVAAVGTAVAIPNLAAANPPPTTPVVQTVPPPPPPAPAIAPHPAPHPPHPVVPAFTPFLLAPPVVPLATVLPISPPVARPIPPSGTAQVTQGASAPQREREDEAASEFASSSFSAYDPSESSWSGLWLVALVIVAAGAGVGINRGFSRGRRRPALARARAERQRQVPR
jgi:hypothetical protein